LKAFLLSAFAVTLLSGCADLDVALATMADELSFADGYYFPDESHTEALDGDCPVVWEYGRTNNQAYTRVRNTGDYEATVTINWSAGSASTLYLQPDEISAFEYRSGSITPDRLEVSC